MLIPSHPMPAGTETLLAMMREALTRARDWEVISPKRADAWGTLAGTAIQAAIDIDRVSV